METKQTEVEKLTAMQHLINWIDSDCTPMDCVMKAKELLQMEKEQGIELIKDACMYQVAGFYDKDIAAMTYEDVYNTYYNKN